MYKSGFRIHVSQIKRWLWVCNLVSFINKFRKCPRVWNSDPRMVLTAATALLPLNSINQHNWACRGISSHIICISVRPAGGGHTKQMQCPNWQLLYGCRLFNHNAHCLVHHLSRPGPSTAADGPQPNYMCRRCTIWWAIVPEFRR